MLWSCLPLPLVLFPSRINKVSSTDVIFEIASRATVMACSVLGFSDQASFTVSHAIWDLEKLQKLDGNKYSLCLFYQRKP